MRLLHYDDINDTYPTLLCRACMQDPIDDWLKGNWTEQANKTKVAHDAALSTLAKKRPWLHRTFVLNVPTKRMIPGRNHDK